MFWIKHQLKYQPYRLSELKWNKITLTLIKCVLKQTKTDDIINPLDSSIFDKNLGIAVNRNIPI